VNSDCAECYLNLGRIKYDKQLYVDAIKELEIAITKSFTYPFDRMKSYYLLALIYFKINRDGKAVEILSQLIFEHQEIMNKGYLKNFIDPKHYTPAYLLTGLYYRNNDLLDESYKGPEIKKYKDKTTPNMDEKDLNYIFGKNTLYFLISIDLNYRKDFCNYFLYEYYKSKNQFDNAFRYLNQALTINPNIQTEITGATWIKDYMILDDIES
jgi:tetratricopeptide (TPR) repeat protein